MTTNFTIYQLKPDDNAEAIATVRQGEMAATITDFLLKKGLDVWYEPDQFEKAFKHMVLSRPVL